MQGITSRFPFSTSVHRASWRLGEYVHRRIGAESSDGGTVRSELSVEPSASGRGAPSSLHRPVDAEFATPRPMEGVANPVLTAGDVTDYGDVDFVADPFLFVPESGDWHLFFEVFNRHRRPTAVIGHATSGDRGHSWEYDRVVLRSDVHLAFPYVFEWHGTFYMVPDRWNRETPASVVLYRAETFPDGWEPVATLVEPDSQLADCVVFRWEDRWWALLGSLDGESSLHLYYSDDLVSDDWTPHAGNPVVTGRPQASRPGGRPIVREDGILVFFQDCAAQYGDKVRAFEIERLSPEAYADRERRDSPILEASGRRLGWNSGRMHHVDPWYTTDGWRCAVDGNIGLGRRLFGKYHWAIGMYRA